MPQFDVFLSHSSIDKAWVIKLKDDLLRYGIFVWLDKDEIRPGDLFAEALEHGLANCRAMALIISPESIASGWVREEYYRALSLAKRQRATVQLIPILLRDAELPGFLQSRNWLDFQDESVYAENLWGLVWGITGERPSRILTLSELDSHTPPVPIPPASQAKTLPASPPTSNDHSARHQSIPFILGSPVPPSHFVGRQREVSAILDQLANPARGSSAISGEPRVGKTSLLHYIGDPQVRQQWNLGLNSYHFLYLDCYSIIPCSDVVDFWRHTLRELVPYLSDDEALSRQIQELQAQVNPHTAALNNLFDNISRAGRLVVLLLDEFEGLVENLNQNAPVLLYYLRTLLNRPKRGLALVVASREPLKQLCADFRVGGSPFHNVFSNISLLPFTEAEVDEFLVQYRAAFSPTERTLLFKMAGTHPYLVQLVSSLIIQARTSDAPPDRYISQIEAEIERETEGYFSDLLEYSSERERMLLVWSALVQLSRYLPANQVGSKDLKYVFEYFPQEMSQLMKRGFLSGEPDAPVIFSPVFGKYILYKILIAGDQEMLTLWESRYESYLSSTQKETLKDLVDKVIKRPGVIKKPEMLKELYAQAETDQPSELIYGQDVIGGYVLEGKIGVGGLADVFKANHTYLDRPAAIKKLHPAFSKNEDQRARFLREARAIAALKHPHIVQIYDFGIHDNHYYMIMELIEGENLREYLSTLQRSELHFIWEETLRICNCVAQALDYAHQLGMIHRDVKPGNILLTQDEGVFLSDFGTVRLLNQTDFTPADGWVPGTPTYMAPEQVDNIQEIDHKVDIYALGCVAYEMVTGQVPFDGKPVEVMFKHIHDQPPPPHSIKPELPKEVDRVILEALAKNPHERPVSASQFIGELRQAFEM